MPELPTPPDPQAFYAQVWNIVARIPRGKVTSYGQIAKMLPPPAGVDEATFAEFGALWSQQCRRRQPQRSSVAAGGQLKGRSPNGMDSRRSVKTHAL
ncbi:MAG: MGMT family protein [Anaerolineales bacterium]|uniref:MGMT family protein n=1 Tax=Candidatus Villigracilis vicinus TaxID=3140679 RepID=UPI00313471AC|nr:MGMT family protein [Anaerolineales bacterium]